MKTRKNLIYKLLVITAIIIIANMLFSNIFLRLDITDDNRYTLSNATKDILRNIEQPVTITAYFSEDLPPHIAKNRQDFQEMLDEFTAISSGNVVYEFQSPNEDPEIEKAAMQKGIQPFLINVRDKDQVKQQKAFMGAVIQYEEREEILPFIPMESAMEYALASSIKKVTVYDRKTIAFLQGHGEPPISAYKQAIQELNIMYDIAPVTLTDTANALAVFETVVIAAPTDSFPDSHLEQLDQFLNRGGKMLIAIDRVEGNLQELSGFEVTTRLETWLASRGIVVDPSFAIDVSCAQVGVQQERGMYRFEIPVNFHYIPIITNFADHPVSKGLESVMLQFASPINYLGDSTMTFKPIMTTSENSGAVPAQTYFDIQKQWNKNDFPMKHLPVAAVIESRKEIQPFKMIVFGDGTFAVNGEGQSAQQKSSDNINVFVNAIDYLSDDTGLVELRTKSVTNRPIDQIEEGKKSFLKYFNFLLPIVLIIGYGIFRSQHRKIKRIKRTQKGYVD